MSDSTAILIEVTELASPFLRQILDQYLSIGQVAADVGLKSREFKAEAKHHLKAAAKEVVFAKKLYDWTMMLGKYWAESIQPKLNLVLKHCTIDLGLKFIRSLPDLTKRLSVNFLDRAPEICAEIIDEIYELVGRVGRVELSTSEVSRIIKRWSTVPNSGQTVKFSGDDGKIVVAAVLTCDEDSDKIIVKEFDGLEKTLERGEKLLKLVPQPQVEDFCLIQGGSYRSQVGILEHCDSGVATVRLLPGGDSKQIELNLLARISAKKADAAVALFEMIERCERAESVIAHTEEESLDLGLVEVDDSLSSIELTTPLLNVLPDYTGDAKASPRIN